MIARTSCDVRTLNGVLVRDHDLSDADGLAAFVTHGHLALAVGAELGGLALPALARLCQILENLVGVIDRRRHQGRRFAGGITEHDALVACTFLAVAAGIDALRDVGGLGMQQDLDDRFLPVEAVLFVANVTDRGAGNLGDVLIRDRAGPARFARDDDMVRRRQRFAGGANVPRIDPRLRPLPIEEVDDLIRDTVTDFVGMAFGNGFAREQVRLARQGGPPELDVSFTIRAGFCSLLRQRSSSPEPQALLNRRGTRARDARVAPAPRSRA